MREREREREKERERCDHFILESSDYRELIIQH